MMSKMSFVRHFNSTLNLKNPSQVYCIFEMNLRRAPLGGQPPEVTSKEYFFTRHTTSSSRTHVDQFSVKRRRLIANASMDPLVIDSRLKQYAKLSKIRLTGFVTSTVITGGFIASQSFAGSLSVIATAALGTFLCSSSAAALNQFLETPYDSQMRRTAIRPLVIGQVTPLETVIFALVTGISGVAILYNLVNGLTAALGAANLLLYSFVYTPMKRSNVANTWIGSIVGAVPPLMGSTAVLGHISVDAAALALILFSWQFPHFNALSWNLRHEYARAGYRMMSVVNPDLCKRVALRHSGLLLAYSTLLPIYGSTSSLFPILALPFNIQFIRLSWHFHERANSASSRRLFRFSLLYLPSILALLVMTQPRGRVFSSKATTDVLERRRENEEGLDPNLE